LDKTFQDPGKIRSFINLESEQGFLNLDSILEAKEPRIAGVVFGRGDYISSLNDKTVGVDSEFVYEKLERVSKKCHSLSLKFGIGGGVTHLSQEQLQNISYLDFFETRKIVFRVEILKNRKDVFRTIIEKALLFEICWLKVKAKKFQEDPEDTRIENLFKRMKEKY
jgi:hypothetical protein